MGSFVPFRFTVYAGVDTFYDGVLAFLYRFGVYIGQDHGYGIFFSFR